MPLSLMTEKTWTVYRHISPSGKVYIGITTKPIARRWNNGLGYKPCKLFWRAILKYGWGNIQHEVLFIGLSEDRAKQLEINLIRHHKSLNISYNITDGGDGMLGYHHSQETLQKIRDSHLNRVYKRGWKWTEKQKANKPKRDMSGPNNPNYGNHKLAGENHPLWGKHLTEETRRKISEASTGRTHKMPQSQKELLIKFNSKAVIQLSLSNEIIAKFQSATAAARFYGKTKATANHIMECCRGIRKTCINSNWIYDE